MNANITSTNGIHCLLKTLSLRVLVICFLGISTLNASGLPWPAWQEVLSQPDSWYESPEAYALAERVLLFQRESGGWPKNMDFSDLSCVPPTPESERDEHWATIDNHATTLPIRFLARVIHSRGEKPDSPLVHSVTRGLDYLLEAQYPNGGWPQYYPLRGGYYDHITYNDNAMIRALTLLKDVSEGADPFGFVDENRRKAAAQAMERGITCILRTQVYQRGLRTAWCAQHDASTLKPAWARNFEPPSLSGFESVEIVRFLMQIRNPSQDVVIAVVSALEWMDQVRIRGMHYETFEMEDGQIDRRLLPDGNAPDLWARFYELGSNRPVYFGRDRILRYNIADIERERRVGYAYIGRWADKLFKEANVWRESMRKQGKLHPTIFLAGDSTMADKPDPDYPERGWGQLFRERVRFPARLENHAQNGRSTASFIREGRWQALLDNVDPGDWVILQFGHNDQKADRPERYAPAHGAYRDNLMFFIRSVREKGGHPILATSVARRNWDDQGVLIPTHGEYPDVVRALASEEKVPLMDLEHLTSDLYRDYGVEDSKRLHLWFAPGEHPRIPDGLSDNTHYSETGARIVAGLVADSIKRLELPLAQWLHTPDVVVAADGSGDYRSLQQAIYEAPWMDPGDGRRWHIRVKCGEYSERVYVQRERGNILVRGDDPLRTIITYGLHAKNEGSDGKLIGTFATPTVTVDGDGMIWEDITIANTAGPVAQALALRADGDRLVFRRCRFVGWQDTVFVNRGRHYFEDCSIEGHVDFIFGGATAYFSRCHIHCLGDGYITAASTPVESKHGMVFYGGTITTAPGVKTYLGRPWRNYAKTAFISMEMAEGIRSEGWHNWGRVEAERTVEYVEFGNHGDGAVLEGRVPWARRPTDRDIKVLSNPATVLGGSDAWDPLWHR